MSKELSPAVLAAAAALGMGATISDKGDVTFTAEAITKGLEESGLKPEVIKEYQAGVPVLVAAAKLATAEISKEQFGENAELAQTNSSLRFGTDTLATRLYRSRENRNPQTGEVIKTPWATSSTITSTVTKPNGQNKLAAEHIRAMYANMAVDA